ncbi:MAG: CARDB domain-containing protein [Candidatus Thermoplasmatota archaeon]
MRSTALFVVLFFLCASFANFCISEKSRAGEVDPIQTEDGLYWAPVKRITNNGQSDTKPQIVVDKNQYSRILWQRSGYWYLKVDRYGNPTSAEKFITNKVVTGWGAIYNFGPTIAMDSQESAHVVWDDSWQTVYYSKIDRDGVTLVPQTIIGQYSGGAHTPSVAVGPDDYVHVVHEYYKYQCEDIVYTKLNNDGTIVTGKQYIAISSDVEYHCEHATIMVDQDNEIHISFGSENGGWVSRINQYAVKDAASVKVYSSPAYSAGAMAVSPDKNLHVTWLDTGSSWGSTVVGTLYYSKYSNDGTQVYKSKVPITPGKTATSQPSIVADSQNNVFIFWSDNREGSSKIFYVKLPNEDWDTVPNPIVLTNANGEAKNPAVAIDAADNLHVAWDDTRDGNKEIYYKFAFNFNFNMGMTPEEQMKVMFVHPNERKSANLTIRNTGGLNDTINLALNTDKVLPGWNFTLDKYSVTLLPLQMEKIVLTVIGPPTGNDGDVSIVVINATSVGNPLKKASITVRSILVVDHKLDVRISDKIKATPPNVMVSFTVQIVNLGDVDDDIDIIVSKLSGWTISSELSRTYLKPKGQVLFLINVTPPSTALAGEEGKIIVTAKSLIYAGVHDNEQATVIITPSVFLELKIDENEKHVKPGRSVDYIITVINHGNMPSGVLIILEIVTGTGDWSAELDTTTLVLPGNRREDVRLTVTAPEDGIAGARLVIKVEGFNEERTVSDEVYATTIIEKVFELDIKVSPDMVEVLPGDTTILHITALNKGNAPLLLDANISELPNDWGYWFEIDTEKATSFHLNSKQSKKFDCVISVPKATLAGKYTGKIKLTTIEGNVSYTDFTIIVKQIYGVDISVLQSKLVGSPGGSITYAIILKNEGNGIDTIFLSKEALPKDWKAEFKTVEETLIDSIAVGPDLTARINCKFPIPKDAIEGTYNIVLIANSEGDRLATDSIALIAEVLAPDLVIANLQHGAKFKAGGMYPFEAEVRNIGAVTVENVSVSIYQDGKIKETLLIGRIPPGGSGKAVFTWLGAGGSHKLKFVVDPDNNIMERDEGNNFLEKRVAVSGEEVGLIANLSNALLLLLICVLVIAAIGFMVTRPMKKAEEKVVVKPEYEVMPISAQAPPMPPMPPQYPPQMPPQYPPQVQARAPPMPPQYPPPMPPQYPPQVQARPPPPTEDLQSIMGRLDEIAKKKKQA